LSDYYHVKAKNFYLDEGRFTVVTAGAEVGYTMKSVTASLFGRFLVSGSKGANLDRLGSLAEEGVGQGSLGLKLAYNF